MRASYLDSTETTICSEHGLFPAFDLSQWHYGFHDLVVVGAACCWYCIMQILRFIIYELSLNNIIAYASLDQIFHRHRRIYSTEAFNVSAISGTNLTTYAKSL